jgi:hypothetical protein
VNDRSILQQITSDASPEKTNTLCASAAVRPSSMAKN